MFGLTDDDRRLRDAARDFADELVPFEVAGRARRRCPAAGTRRASSPGSAGARAVRDEHADVGRRTRAARCCSRCSCRSRSAGSRTALAWVMHTPPAWWVDVATDEQRERWLVPAVRGERHECYAITEEFAGSDVSALATTAVPGRRRLRRQRREVARHVVQPGRLLLRAGGAAGRRHTSCSSSTSRRRASRWCARRRTRTTSPTTTRSCRSPTSASRARNGSAGRARAGRTRRTGSASSG